MNYYRKYDPQYQTRYEHTAGLPEPRVPWYRRDEFDWWLIGFTTACFICGLFFTQMADAQEYSQCRDHPETCMDSGGWDYDEEDVVKVDLDDDLVIITKPDGDEVVCTRVDDTIVQCEEQ